MYIDLGLVPSCKLKIYDSFYNRPISEATPILSSKDLCKRCGVMLKMSYQSHRIRPIFKARNNPGNATVNVQNYAKNVLFN